MIMKISDKAYNRLWFLTITVMLFVQYVRPQDLVGSLQGTALFAPIAGIIMLFAVFSNRKGNILAFSQIRLFLFFTAWMVFLVPFSQSQGAAIRGLMDFLPLIPFVIAIPLLVNNVQMLKNITNIFILLTVVIAVTGIVTHAGERYAMFGLGNFLTDPNDFSLFMVTMLPLAFFMMMYEKKSKIRKLFYASATVLAIASVVISFSRGGFLAMLCVFFIMWLFSPNKKITAAVAAIMLMGVLIFSSSQWKEVASSSFDTSQSTAQTRLTTWRLSLEVFVDHPMGVGMNNIPNTMYKYADAWETPSRWWGDVNHSFWLTALAEGGIIGFILVMMILWHNVKDCLKISQIAPINDDLRFMKFFGYAFFGSLIGFLAAGTLLTVNYYPHLWYMTGIITAGSHVTYLLEKEYK